MTTNTANRGYQLPNPANFLDEDVLRLISALQAIDADMASVLAGLLGKAAAAHGHVINDVAGLQQALDGKQAVGVYGSLGSLSDVSDTAPANNMFLRFTGAEWAPVAFDASMIAGGTINVARLPSYLASTSLSSTYAPLSHSHSIAQVTGLQGALDAKAPVGNYARTDAGNVFSGQQTFSGGITPGFTVNKIGGDNGGRLVLEKADTNSTLAGSVRIETYRDNLIVYEDSGGFRGVYVNLAAQAAGQSRLLTENDQSVKAWVTFNGGFGATSIIASRNVSSVVRNGTGDYTINFANAMSDANYAVSITARQNGTGDGISGGVDAAAAPTASAVRVQLFTYGYPASTASSSASDAARVSVAIIG